MARGINVKSLALRDGGYQGRRPGKADAETSAADK